ncbi:MAG TPA: patatin-like protein, partial [Thermoanaerobaculia bacterium]|nr:patatin-like protein [Thermoanaerobaculia bacterium]
MADLATAPAERERQREVRLGLVMYGGVSLAIYINGVAREFFRAVKGNGVYKILKRLIDSDIVVDIISGTSAGGINGIFLAYALANSKDFSTLANLWRDDGDIAKLLRDPDNLPATPVNSVLDSDGFYQEKLREAFETMGEYHDDGADEPSPMNELDLFVPSTNIYGNVMTIHDDQGHLIDVKEHRAVFQLKHRAGRKEPFNPSNYKQPGALFQALARLSRMTSAFSAAFAPVEVTKQSDDAVRDCADKAIQLWGHLGHHSYFIDGGVLDNKPFTYTIRDMAFRTKDREIDRILFYVEPDPEMFDALKKAQADEKADQPTLLNSVVGGALSIPSYESIASDLQLLADYNARVQQYERVCTSRQKSALPSQPRTLEQLAGDWQGSIYVRTRLVQISDRVVDGLLRVNGFDTLLHNDDREIANVLVKTFHDDHEAAKAGLRLDPANTLTSFDVYFHQRRLFYVADSLRKSMKEGHDGRDALKAVNRTIKLLEIVRYWMEQLVDVKEFDWRPKAGESKETSPRRVWDEVKRAFQDLLQQPMPEIPTAYELVGGKPDEQLK